MQRAAMQCAHTLALETDRVLADLDAVLGALRREGCEMDERSERSEYGRFGWVVDPEGNRLDLWEPPNP